MFRRFLPDRGYDAASLPDGLPESRGIRRGLAGGFTGLMTLLDQMTDGLMERGERLLPDEGLEEEGGGEADAFDAAGEAAARRFGRGHGTAKKISALLLMLALACTAALLFIAIRCLR